MKQQKKNQIIQELTGITNNNLEGTYDFITVFDKFSYWRGEGDITTFCWSKNDHNQLWCELEAKACHRYDLFACLKNFVDLQKVFGKLISSKVSVSLESAMRLLQMDYKGQVHNAYSDSFNTARILHKLFCTESLDLDFDYINPKKNNDKTEYKVPSTNYNCSFASFMSPELLAQFGLTAEEDSEDDSYAGRLCNQKVNEAFVQTTEKRFGQITKRCVLYRGKTYTEENGIEYKNVEEYLCELGE